MTTGSTAMAMEIETLRWQRARCVLQIVMLRDALKEVQMVAESSVKTHGYDKQHVRNADVAKRALAATDDLDGLIVCEKEPVATIFRSGRTSAGKPWHNACFKEDGSIDLPQGTSLYRAWEPK